MTLIKSDGGFTYDTSDLACLKYRLEHENADRILYVTDAGQSTHFHILFRGAEEMKLMNSYKILVKHLPFGVVLGKDKKKFKTRSGEAEKRAAEKAVTMSCVKYADLSCNREKAYVFDFD